MCNLVDGVKMKAIDNANHQSVLLMKKIYFDKLIFENKDNDISSFGDESQLEVGANFEPSEEETILTLISRLSRKREDRIVVVAELSLKGYFALEGNNDIETRKHFQNNMLAILFPYLRSQFTILTSQPGFEPIVLPPMNINAILNTQNIMKQS